VTEKENEELLRILEDPRLERELETLYLRLLIHTPSEKWTDVQWEVIKANARKLDSNFWERLISGRLDRLDWGPAFLHYNWEALQFPNPENHPGLCEWHRLAVTELFVKQGFYCGGKKWYEKRRQELHLTPKLTPKRTYAINKCPKSILEQAPFALPLPFLLRSKE
jgi:hypothetical protein